MKLVARFALGSSLLLPLCYFSMAGSVSQAANNMVMTSPSPVTTPVSRGDYGIDVFSYDSQLNLPSTVPTLQKLGMGMQQFPNDDNQWSWVTDSYRSGGQAPVSLNDWGRILESTGNNGLFIFNYDANPTFTGGGTAQDASSLTQYIVQHHLPITAIVIGSEEYGQWDFSANLNPSYSAAYYAQSAAQIAQAIHAVDPAMKVGVCLSPTMGSYSRNWNQTVLRADGPYINFISIHDYPISDSLSNSGLLTEIPQYISQVMSYIHQEIAANVSPANARNVQTWVTEYNPYSQPNPQSITPVYGAAMVESAMLWKSYGAQKLFIWSYDGQAHVAIPSLPVATNASAPFGVFALSGDGQSPEIAANALYPSGEALSQYMAAIGDGGLLSTWTGDGVVVGQVNSNSGHSLFLINQNATGQSILVNGQIVDIPSASLLTTTLPSRVVSLSLTANTERPISENSTTYQPTPKIQSPDKVYDGESITLNGQYFGDSMSSPAYIEVSQGNTNYGGPGNAYHIAISRWSPTAVTFTVPNGSSGPALALGDATVQLVTAEGIVSNTARLTVVPAPQLAVSLATSNVLQPGSRLTVTGSNFGPVQGSGYVLISQNSINYGAPQNYYKIAITHWTNNTVSFVIPNGSSGPALTPGSATLQIFNNGGLSSPVIHLSIQPFHPVNASLKR